MPPPPSSVSDVHYLTMYMKWLKEKEGGRREGVRLGKTKGGLEDELCTTSVNSQ